MIPKIIHQIYLNPPIPEKLVGIIESHRRINTNFEMKMWGVDNLPKLTNIVKVLESDLPVLIKSDCIRYELLYEFGGFYMDVDIEALKPIDDLCEHEFICGLEVPGLIGTALIASIPKHPLVKKIEEVILEKSFNHTGKWTSKEALDASGPFAVDPIIRDAGIKPFPEDYFYAGAHKPRELLQIKPESYTYHYFHGVSGPGGWVYEMNGWK